MICTEEGAGEQGLVVEGGGTNRLTVLLPIVAALLPDCQHVNTAFRSIYEIKLLSLFSSVLDVLAVLKSPMCAGCGLSGSHKRDLCNVIEFSASLSNLYQLLQLTLIRL